MVTHDYERGVITGLPRSVVAEARRTGRFPREAMHPVMAQVWERLSGGRVAPPGFVDTPGVSRAPDKGDVGTPTPENPWDWMCSCHEPVSKRFRVGSACGDEGKGRVARVSEFSARTGDALCVGGYDCVGGDGCACYKTARDVGIFYTDTECAEHGGQTPDSAVDCASATFVGGEACSCRIQCNDGTWVQTGSAKASGYRFCRGEADGEAWGDTAESVSDLACEGPRTWSTRLEEIVRPAECTFDPVMQTYYFATHDDDVQVRTVKQGSELYVVHQFTKRTLFRPRCEYVYVYDSACKCVGGPSRTKHEEDEPGPLINGPGCEGLVAGFPPC